MAVSLSTLAGLKLSIDREYFHQQIVDSFLSDKRCASVDLGSMQRKGVLMQDTDSGILLSNDPEAINSIDAGNEVVFYHPVKGVIFAYQKWGIDWDEYCWVRLFSTMQFVANLKYAESNPNVVAHFLHINSGGGECWMLDVATAAMRSCKKPIYAFVERICASAAYRLAAQAMVIKTFTDSDLIGSIGTYVKYLDVSEWMKMNGLKDVEVYASQSDLKNKMDRDLEAGHPEQFVREILDPANEQFIADVRCRKKLASLPDDSPVLRGEIFRASEAVKSGLIDGVLPDLSAAIQEAHDLGVQVRDNNQLLTNI